jgi:hypothetical protein
MRFTLKLPFQEGADMVSKWCISLLVLVMALPAFADKASTNVQPFSTPAMVIHPDEHVAIYRTEFDARISKSAYWAAETQKQGYDLAFTEWLLEEHPWEFAAICSNAAANLMKDPAMSSYVDKFHEAAKQDPVLQNQIKTTNEPVTFLDWLRTNNEGQYKHVLANVGVSDASSRWAHETYGWGPP